MAAANTDKFIKVASNTGWQLGAAGISDAVVDTFSLVSPSGLPTDTAVLLTIDRVDSSGVKTPSKMERIIGIVSGSNIVSCLRGVEGTAQAHSGGAVVEVVICATNINYLLTALLVEHGQDGKHIAPASAKTSVVDADLFSMFDSAASFLFKKITWANIKATLKTYFDTLYSLESTGGWESYSTVVPTRASADDPTYTLTFTGVDLTSILSEGMKVKWTQNSIVRYGFINSAPSYGGGNTTVTILTRCDSASSDYDVLDTATYAISAFNYSSMKAPFGFPMDPSKWTIIKTDTTLRSQSTPTTGTWYNPGSNSISIPIGSWNVSYNACIGADDSSAMELEIMATLSTANNSSSDSDFNAYCKANAVSKFYNVVSRLKLLTLASKTVYYFNIKSGATGTDNIYLRNNNEHNLDIKAVCAYL